MGEGSKEKVPEDLILDADELPAEPIKLDTSKMDTSDPEAMREALRAQMPEGMDFEFEEVDDAEYERIMADARTTAEGKEKADAPEIDAELADTEAVEDEHIIDEL